MNFYENLLILNPHLDEKTVDEAVGQVKDIIVRKGGEPIKADKWGHKKLAYQIKKQGAGYYILILFKAPPSAISELEKFYRIFDPVLKFIFIKLKKKQIEAAVSSAPAVEAQGTAPVIPEEENKNV